MKKYIIGISISLLFLIGAIAGVFTLQFYKPKLGFHSLKDLKEYAKNFEENPPADNKDWLNPDFNSFHENRVPNFISRQLNKYLGYGKSYYWNANQFKELLEKVVTDREAWGLSGDKVARLSVANTARLIVWGEMHGAFHSLVRCLDWLHEQGIIDDDLTIIKPTHYFVFNGDFINRSPFSLESLTVILLLIVKNPDTVFYMRGMQESNSYWHNFSLKNELKMFAGHVSGEDIPLGSLLDRFFNTLPLALYVSCGVETTDVMRISYVSRLETKQIDEDYFGNLFDQTDLEVVYYDINKRKKIPKPVDIKAIIRAEDWRKEQITRFGLGFLKQDKGATSWAVLSSPTMIYQQYFDFYYDAFAIVDFRLPITSTSISLYNRDVRSKEGFKLSGTYNMLTGVPEVTFDPEKPYPQPDFILGSSMSLMGKMVQRGLSLKVNEQNRLGGIHDRKLRTYIYEDEYSPYLTRRNINQLLKQKADLIFLPIGSPTLSSYLDYVIDDKLLVLFPITGSVAFRDDRFKNIIHLRASYTDEVKALIDYLITEYGSQKIAFFYQDDSFGSGIVDSAKEMLQANGITDFILVPYTRGVTDFKEQVAKIREAQPDAIALFSTANAAQELIRQMGIDTLTNTKLFGISFVGEALFRRFVKGNGLSVLIANVVPDPNKSMLPIVVEYRKAMDEHNYPYDVFSLEAYIATSILLDVLKKIDRPLTTDKVKRSLEGLSNYKFKGLTLTFDPKTRTLSHNVWLDDGQDKEWILIKG